jgi:hypothetical protein
LIQPRKSRQKSTPVRSSRQKSTPVRSCRAVPEINPGAILQPRWDPAPQITPEINSGAILPVPEINPGAILPRSAGAVLPRVRSCR